MCGIAGSTNVTRAVLDGMNARLVHRGPDGDGLWLEDGLGLAHRRLAVIDLTPGGAQPMLSPDGRYVIVFNGEIYNFAELRRELQATGEVFASESDTEVLLRLLARKGEAGLDRLVGMFAIALWDRAEKRLLLARDRLGIKPLVYGLLGDGGIAFASEINALKAHPGIDLEIDPEALSQYLACLYVPAPLTLHRGIRKLPPGHLLRWQNGKTEIAPWWQPRLAGTRRPSQAEAVEELLPLVRRAVVDRMVADVPVGCFLSGGVDSSLIAAIMAEEAKTRGAPPIRTFTMTFDEPAYDEREAAASVAAQIGSQHTELAAAASLVDRLPEYIRAFGEPFGNPTALLIHDLSRKAREHVTVALVGDGGDEVFAGYPRYKGGLLAQRLDVIPQAIRSHLLAPAARLIPESSRGHHGLRRAREFLAASGLGAGARYASWVEYFDPAERAAMLGLSTLPTRPIEALYDLAPSSHPLDAMQQTDLLSFLPGNLLAYGDAMSMAHALELRLPLIDHRLIEAVGQISADLRFEGGMKTLLRGIAKRLLPAHLVDRPKRGFNPPMGVWLKTDLAAMVEERLTADSMNALGLDFAPIARIIAENRRGGRDHSLKIWSLLVLDAWKRWA